MSPSLSRAVVALSVGALGGCTLLLGTDGFVGGAGSADVDACASCLAAGDADGALDGSSNPDAGPRSDAASEVGLSAFDAPNVLAKDQTGARNLVLDDDNAYWVNASGNVIVARASRRPPSYPGAAIALIDTILLSSTLGARGTIALSAQNVFFSRHTSQNVVVVVSKAGVRGPDVSTSTGYFKSVVRFGTTLFGADDGVYSVAEDGTGFASLGGTSPLYMQVDATSIYYSTNNQIQRMSKAGAAAVLDVVADGQGGVRGLAVDATQLYWVNDAGQVLGIDKTVTLGTPQVLASGQAGPSSIAVNSTEIFWTNAGDGTVMHMLKAGGTPELVAQGGTSPASIAVDDLGACWIDNGTDIVGVLRR